MMLLLDRWFGLREHRTTVRTEVLGGITTFATMAYIIVVNPAILEYAKIPREPSTVATILAAVFGCLLMGLYANRPFAVAPYMGENAFIAFGLAATVPAEERLGAVFVSGVLFLLLTLLKAREWLAAAISPSLKYSFSVGIGLFMLLIGLYETGIVERAGPDTPLKIGDWGKTEVQLALGGFLVMAVLQAWGVRGAILLGIAATAAAGYLVGLGDVPERVVGWPWEYGLESIAFSLDALAVLRVDFASVLLTLFLISFLDTLGTIFALGAAAGMLDARGNLPDLHRPMVVDSLACIFSSLVGTSTSGVFIESATGIREGARTGLAAVVTGLLFAAALFFIPLVQPLQALKFAYYPALMVVGVMMFAAARHIDADDWTELLPALVTIAMMAFTYNIANGLTAGLIVHPVMKLATGRWRQLHPGAVILGVLCLTYYLAGQRH